MCTNVHNENAEHVKTWAHINPKCLSSRSGKSIKDFMFFPLIIECTGVHNVYFPKINPGHRATQREIFPFSVSLKIVVVPL